MFIGVPSNSDECLLSESSYNNKKCFVATLYRWPSQSREEFEKIKDLNKSNIQSKRRNLHSNR